MLKLNKIKFFTLLIAGACMFGSCAKELDINPESAVSPDQISASNIQFFLNGLYLNTFGSRDDHFLNDIRGGNYTWTALSGNSSAYGILITGNGLDDNNSFSSRIWTDSYQSIYNANIILDAASKLEATPAINQVIAETSYLRAYLYYQLTTTFGDVPLILSNTTDDIPKTPQKEVWAHIIADLDVAAAQGRTNKTTGFKTVSVEAAKALKARVLLATGDKAGAASLAKEVIDQSGKTVATDYATIFRNTAASTEVIFAFENLKTEKNLRLSQLFWPYGTTWAGSYFVQPSDEVLNDLYPTGDIRKDVNIQKITNSDGTFNMIVSKYWDVQPLIISRISEMYLICAEGFSKEIGIDYLNAVRSKRGLSNLTLADAGSDDAYLNTVLLERRRELYSEGFLFYDLVRTDKAASLSNIKTREKYVMPIPGTQVTLSKGILIQNSGY